MYRYPAIGFGDVSLPIPQWFETGRIREDLCFQLRRLQRPLVKQTEQGGPHRGRIADCTFLLDAGKRNRLGDELQQRLLKRGANQLAAGVHHREHAFPVGDPDACRSEFSRRDTLNWHSNIIKFYCRLWARVTEDKEQLSCALAYPEVGEPPLACQLQKGRPFTKQLDRRICFQTNPLAEGGITKALHVSTELGTVGFNEPLAARSSGGNSATKAC